MYIRVCIYIYCNTYIYIYIIYYIHIIHIIYIYIIYICVCVCNSGLEHVLIFYIFGLVRPIDSFIFQRGSYATSHQLQPWSHWSLWGGQPKALEIWEELLGVPSVPVFYGFPMGLIWLYRDNTRIILGYWWIYPPVSSNIDNMEGTLWWLSGWETNMKLVDFPACHIWLPSVVNLSQSQYMGFQWWSLEVIRWMNPPRGWTDEYFWLLICN